MIKVRAVVRALPQLLFLTITHPTARIAALVLAAAVLLACWVPAAVSPHPWVSVPGAALSAALGLGVFVGLRYLLRLLWRSAAKDSGFEMLALLCCLFLSVLGVVGAALLVGGPFRPHDSELSTVGALGIAVWGLHEAFFCAWIYRQTHQEREAAQQS